MVNASKLQVNISIAKRFAELRYQGNYLTKIGDNYVLRRQVEIDDLDLLDMRTVELTRKLLSAWSKACCQFLPGLKVVGLFEGAIKRLSFFWLHAAIFGNCRVWTILLTSARVAALACGKFTTRSPKNPLNETPLRRVCLI